MSSLLPLLMLGCGSDYEPTPEELEAQRKYREEQIEREKHTIFYEYQFQNLARVEGSGSATLGVKVLRDKQGVLHFMDTKVWPFHYPFCVSMLGETRTLQEFNEQVYTGKDRSMMFATVVSYPVRTNIGNYYCLELNPADPMRDLNALDEFFKQVDQNVFYNGTSKIGLYFHPTSAMQVEAIQNKKLSIPVVTSSELFGNVKYRCVQEGEVHNKVVQVFRQNPYSMKQLDNWLLERTAEEIVVIPAVPTDIPVVAGVICGEIIPPLCHVALLCQNRKTPCCFSYGCIAEFKKHNLDHMVADALVAKSGYYCHGKEMGKIENAVTQSITVKEPNHSVKNLIDIGDKEAQNGQIVGAKAAQLAKIESIYSQPTFKGTFAIPFSHYEKHLSADPALIKHVLQPALDRMTAHAHEKKEAKPATPKHGQPQQKKPFDYNEFSKVQQAMMKVAVDEELLTSVIEKITQNGMTAVIFRSSTNAEDLPGFNGAGLYESVPLKGADATNREKVANAIQKVWASVWNPKAVKERQFYGMDHRKVQMSILVQQYLDQDTASHIKVHTNGVCITHDVARHKAKHGFMVNCYPRAQYRATNHYANKHPEHTMLVLGREKDSVDRQLIATSSESKLSVITQEDAEKMVRVFGDLHTTLLAKPHKMDDTVALDIEFMVIDNDKSGTKRDLVVLQARPYHVNIAPENSNWDEDVKSFCSRNTYYNTDGGRIVKFSYLYPQSMEW